MTKPIDSLTQDIDPAASKVTPMPELVGAAVPPNGQVLPSAFVAPSAPLPWAAQPLAPLQDEATVPLPMEDVEIAGPDGGGGEDDVEIIDAGSPAQPEAQLVTPPPVPVSEPPNADGSVRITPPPTPARESRPRPPAPPPPPSVVPAASTSEEGLAAQPSAQMPLLPPGATWSEALSQRPRKKRLKPWFEEVFDEDYLRTLPFMTPEQTLREVAFIRGSLQPPADAHVLDVACGYGRHAIELGQGGLRVTGIDLSLPLLIRAADESQRRALSVNFVHADMREMAFESQFDGAYCMLTSFGYFDEETNLKVASTVCKALKPGGRFLLDAINRDYIVSELPTRVWWEGDGCVVLEEVDFNFQTSRLGVRRSVVFQDGRQVEHEISIRAYSLHELGKLLRQAGFRVLEVSGGLATRGHFFGSTSRSIIMLCERPAE
jgi:SAM-dependent methyltransferase